VKYTPVESIISLIRTVSTIPLATKNRRNATDPAADLATDTLALLRRPGPLHRALFHCQNAIERNNSRSKLTFNLKYHKDRGWEAVYRCCLSSTIAMLVAVLAATETGHPDKVRKA
jgi:hypothetical protein